MISWGFLSKCDNVRVTLLSYKRPIRVLLVSIQQNGMTGQSSDPKANPIPTSHESCHLYPSVLRRYFLFTSCRRKLIALCCDFRTLGPEPSPWELGCYTWGLLHQNHPSEPPLRITAEKRGAGSLQGSLDTSKGRLYIQCPAVYLGRCAEWITSVQDGIWRVCTHTEKYGYILTVRTIICIYIYIW